MFGFAKFFNILIVAVFCLSLSSCDKTDTNENAELKQELKQIKEAGGNGGKINPKNQPADSGPIYKEGKDYTVLENPYVTGSDDKVIVYEFFGYTCPHCFHFEPYMEEWLITKPAYVKLVRVPLNFHESWAVYQQGYLTAEVMGVANRVHKKLFDEIHLNHISFLTIEEMAQWYAENTGVDKDEFLSTADSFILDSKLREADKMGFAMQVTGTPTIVVDGKYKLSNKVKDRKTSIKVLNFLIKKEAEEKGLIKE